MLGSHTFFIPGCILIAIGLTLQAGATGAVKAVKMSANLSPGASQPAGMTSPPASRLAWPQAEAAGSSAVK